MLLSKLEIPKKYLNENLSRGLYDFREEVDHSLLILKQPDNMEKTTELFQFILSTTKQIIWYNLDYLDNEEATFLKYMKEAFKKKMAGLHFGDEWKEESLNDFYFHLKCMVDIISSIVEYLGGQEKQEEFCLVLDNFQEIENQMVYRMIQQLVDNVPKGIQLFIVTDAELPHFLNRYLKNGTAYLLHPNTPCSENSLRERKLHAEELALTVNYPTADRYALTEELTLEDTKKQETAQTRPVSHLNITFFGDFCVKDMAGGEEICWRTRREKQLFAYLFALHGKVVDRGNLLETLWPDEIPVNGVAMLHNMIYHIRKELKRLRQGDILKYEKKNIG